LSKKLKGIQDNVDLETQTKLKNGVKVSSTTSYLPDDLADYILSLKRNLDMAESILPDSLFKRPVFFGKEDFYYRLASELLSFGLAYQRVNLQPARLSKLAELFHKHRVWWKCDIQDIKRALDTLCEHKVINHSSDGYLFEPLTLSKEIHDFLAFIANKINEFAEISLNDVYQVVPWAKTKIDSIIDLMVSNKICIYDKGDKKLFFPELKQGL